MIVQIDNLKKYFGKTKAVNDVSFSFDKGNIFGFVGPNGAGKTTTMRILSTLDSPTHGDVKINGESVIQYPEKARAVLGFMPDQLPDHSDITVHEYIDFFARTYNLRGKDRKRSVDQVKDFTGLNNIDTKYLSALSKGMKQRVSLARSIVHNPSVLVLDEPAAGLDPRARLELRELLKQLSTQGKAILISSHILTELEEIVDGVVIIEQGKIVQAGLVNDLSKQARQHQRMSILILDENLDQAIKDIILMPNVMNVTQAGKAIQVDLQGDAVDCADLLSAIIQKGHRVVEFRHDKMDLEDIFMSLTKGVVQ